MLRSIIICPDLAMTERLEAALRAQGEVSVFRTWQHYLSGPDLTKALRAHAPDVIFLSFESVERAQATVRYLEDQSEAAQIIAVHRVCDAKVLRDIMVAGVREFVSEPFERGALADALRNTAANIQRRPTGYESSTQILSFLPSKAGVGTSTLALNVSAALASSTGAHVLLTDFDLHSGMVRFLLKLQTESSVLNAIEHVTGLDRELWSKLITSINNLDVLHAGRINPSMHVEPPQVRNLLHFASTMYQVMCFDLSGNLEQYSLEIMEQSKRILLVCTPEIPSLHLAKEKLGFLRSMDLSQRVGVVLNRVARRPVLGKEQVEQLLGVPVIASLPNDYHLVARATSAGTVVDPVSELGKQYAKFSAGLVDAPPAAAEKKKAFEYLPAPISSLARR